MSPPYTNLCLIFSLFLAYLYLCLFSVSASSFLCPFASFSLSLIISTCSFLYSMSATSLLSVTVSLYLLFMSLFPSLSVCLLLSLPLSLSFCVFFSLILSLSPPLPLFLSHHNQSKMPGRLAYYDSRLKFDFYVCLSVCVCAES